MKRLKLNIHSIVDVITNSSTVIYTYQDSVSEAKDLVTEILKLTGETTLTADDIFYYGVFCDDDNYLDYNDNLPDNAPKVIGDYGTDKYKNSMGAQQNWFDEITLAIMMGNMEKPQWMLDVEEGDSDYWQPSTCLHIKVKDKKYKELSVKISSLLGSVTADGGRDG